jgi:hypothetical protein
MIEPEAEKDFGCIDIEWTLILGCCLNVVTALESTDPDTASTSITLDAVDSAINVHLKVLAVTISDLKMKFSDELLRLHSRSLFQGTGLTNTMLQRDPT